MSWWWAVVALLVFDALWLLVFVSAYHPRHKRGARRRGDC